MYRVKAILERLLHPDDVDDFAIWAFGKDYRTITGIEAMREWNLRHCELLELTGTGALTGDLTKMVELWKKEQNRETWKDSPLRWSSQ